jgi:type IV pilus assembly protein PilA
MNHRERGFSLLELLIVVAIIVIITTVAIPRLIGTRSSANEASALKSLQVLNTACVQYYMTYGSYPHNQSDLGPPTNGALSKTAADMAPADLAPPGTAGASKAGYTFRYVAGQPDVNGNIHTYNLLADPLQYKETGVKRFFCDQTTVVRFTSDGSPATAASPLLQ